MGPGLKVPLNKLRREGTFMVAVFVWSSCKDRIIAFLSGVSDMNGRESRSSEVSYSSLHDQALSKMSFHESQIMVLSSGLLMSTENSIVTVFCICVIFLMRGMQRISPALLPAWPCLRLCRRRRRHRRIWYRMYCPSRRILESRMPDSLG